MFRTVPLSIIRSFSLYTQQTCMYCCVRWKIPDGGQRNCPKHVEFHSKNKFEKLVNLVRFIIWIYIYINVILTNSIFLFIKTQHRHAVRGIKLRSKVLNYIKASILHVSVYVWLCTAGRRRKCEPKSAVWQQPWCGRLETWRSCLLQ